MDDAFIAKLRDIGNDGFRKIKNNQDDYLKFLLFYSRNIELNIFDALHIFSQNQDVNIYKTRIEWAALNRNVLNNAACVYTHRKGEDIQQFFSLSETDGYTFEGSKLTVNSDEFREILISWHSENSVKLRAELESNAMIEETTGFISNSIISVGIQHFENYKDLIKSFKANSINDYYSLDTVTYKDFIANLNLIQEYSRHLISEVKHEQEIRKQRDSGIASERDMGDVYSDESSLDRGLDRFPSEQVNASAGSNPTRITPNDQNADYKRAESTNSVTKNAEDNIDGQTDTDNQHINNSNGSEISAEVDSGVLGNSGNTDIEHGAATGHGEAAKQSPSPTSLMVEAGKGELHAGDKPPTTHGNMGEQANTRERNAAQGGENNHQQSQEPLAEARGFHGSPISEPVEHELQGDYAGELRANSTINNVGPLQITKYLEETLQASSITSDEVDSILRDGGNYSKNSVLRIAAHFAKDLSLQENAAFVRDEYLRGRYKYHRANESGKGYQFDDKQVSIWFDDAGIKFGIGKSAISATDYFNITWEQAAERIKQLYDAGHYTNQATLEEALQNEHFEAAESLLHIYRDDSRDFRDVPEKLGDSGGWPDAVAHTTALLTSKEERALILAQLREDLHTFDNYEGSLSHQYHDPHLTLRELEKLDIEPKSFPAANIQSLNTMRFITNDEVDSYLTRGGNFDERKFRIFSHFLHGHTLQERITFLKKEYGHGGGTWIGGGFHGAEPSKGISLKRPDCEDVNLKWPAVAKRIDELIQSGQYMTQAELERIPNYEKLILARGIKLFFDTLPTTEERVQSPFTQNLEFNYPKELEWEAINSFLENQESIADCLEKIQHIYYNTSTDERYYNTRKDAFEKLSAFNNGTYTLFPNITTTTRQAPKLSQPQPHQFSLFDDITLPVTQSAEELRAVNEDIGSESLTQFVQQVEQESTVISPRKRLFIDMDGVLAKFSYVEIDALYQEGYFRNLEPQNNVIEAVKSIIQNRDDIDVYTLSAYLDDSSYALSEKNAWLDEHLPMLSADKRIFVPYGQNKADYVPGGISASDYLLDDFTANLNTWEQSGGQGIKLLNDINNTRGTWTGNKVRFDREPFNLADNIMSVLHGETIHDINPNRRAVLPEFEADINIEPLESSQTQYHPPPEQPITSLSIADNRNAVYPTAPKARITANIEAIKDLHKSDGMDLNKLRLYTGFGGLAEVFDENSTAHRNEFEELQGLLTEKQYASARASILDSYYTDNLISDKIFKALQSMGFDGGNVLEPSCGIGRFFNSIPVEIRQNSKVFGVEVDGLSGEIAKKLNPDIDISIAGFEDTSFIENSFDAVVGNVPFGDFKVYDPKYNKLNLNIHDYFLAKSIDLTRAGGVVAIVTSTGFLDKESSKFRQHVANKCELTGAIRLPNNAFPGTKVNSDILFFTKREKEIVADIENSPWLSLSEVEVDETIANINHYFVQSPNNILGKLEVGGMYRADELRVVPYDDGVDLGELLDNAIESFPKNIIQSNNAISLIEETQTKDNILPVSPDLNLKNFAYTVLDDKIYQREDGFLMPVELSDNTFSRMKNLITIREKVVDIIKIQVNGCSDAELSEKQAELNAIYDDFTKKYGLINSPPNTKIFREDPESALLFSIEKSVATEENGQRIYKYEKADIFTKRTISPKLIEKADTSQDSLFTSINNLGEVNIIYMSYISGIPKEQIVSELYGDIFYNPQLGIFETADNYLSGKVIDKLNYVKSMRDSSNISIPFTQNAEFLIDKNISALEKVQPEKIEAHDISFSIGSTWIRNTEYDKFLYETLKQDGTVLYSKYTSAWKIDKGRYFNRHSVVMDSTYGTSRMHAFDIFESILNQKTPKIYDKKIRIDEFGNEKEYRDLNQEQTILVKEKAKLLKEEFTRWILDNAKRREELTDRYNSIFNSSIDRHYDGSFLTFPGMNPDIKLNKHQKDAVSRILFGGNTLLAHEVGAGKTWTMVAAAKEAKRIGLINKPMFVVPNHLVEQFKQDFLKLYPSANVLSVSNEDFSREKRKRFCAKIVTNDWDGIIIAHSTFEILPVSVESLEEKINQDINNITFGVDELKRQNGEKFTIRQMEKLRKNLEVKLEALRNKPKDNVINFEDLGVDALFVDEAHAYKNKLLYTKMGNVAGLSKSSSQKSYDMDIKTELINKRHGADKFVTFATGTPVSNSMVELFTMKSYLAREKIKELGLEFFDNWAANFGEVVTSVELHPSGKGFRARERFARFKNLPECMSVFKSFADIQTEETLNLPKPKLRNGKITVVSVPANERQKQVVDTLVALSELISKREIAPEVYNMLGVTNDGRMSAIDVNTVNISKLNYLFREHFGMEPIDTFAENETTKVDACVDNITRIYNETKVTKAAQLVFCDKSTPKNKSSSYDKETNEYSVYNVIKQKLVLNGVKPNEVAYIHDAKTDEAKAQLFEKVRNGEVRVLIGSTERMGAGTNVQKNLIALHHADCPWRPADLEQRNGRILRQGNDNPEVEIFNYVTEGTFDAYLYQIIENKQRFISQVMTGKTPARVMEDIDEKTLTFAEVKAIATGDTRIQRRVELEGRVNEYKLLAKNHTKQRIELKQKAEEYIPRRIGAALKSVENLEADFEMVKASFQAEFSMMVGNKTFDKRQEAGEALLSEARKPINFDKKIGEFRGFSIYPKPIDNFANQKKVVLKAGTSYELEISDSPIGAIASISNFVEKAEARLNIAKSELNEYYQELESTKLALEQPFKHDDELKDFENELYQLNLELGAVVPDDIVMSEGGGEVEEKDITGIGMGDDKVIANDIYSVAR